MSTKFQKNTLPFGEEVLATHNEMSFSNGIICNLYDNEININNQYQKSNNKIDKTL